MFCSKCGQANADDARYCRFCATTLAPETQQRVVVVRPAKSPGVAAVLSFFVCGLGQIYNGQIGKGIAMIIAYLISWYLCVLLIGFITTPILWIWGMIDAYKTAERINGES
jgi:TM2 domain-containing membrane protein YozV